MKICYRFLRSIAKIYTATVSARTVASANSNKFNLRKSKSIQRHQNTVLLLSKSAIFQYLSDEVCIFNSM